MTSKEKYVALCNQLEDIPIFFKPWWLDTVSDGKWDAVIYEKGGKILGVLPFIKSRLFYIFKKISSPALTPRLGPLLLYPQNQKYSSKLSFEKEVITGLEEALPAYDIFMQNLNYSVVNWLPLMWKGYEIIPRITYRIDDLSNIDTLYSNLRSNVRSAIKKASNNITIEESSNIKDLFTLVELTYKKQNQPVPFSKKKIQEVFIKCTENNSGKIFIAKNNEDQLNAGAFIIWDNESAYYLIGGGNPEIRDNGATSFLIWEGIKHCATFTKRFDFEGSIIEPIEFFFRGFGATQLHYYKIRKVNSLLIKLSISMRDIFKS